ncbi:hypothetical protein VSU19_05155 [Verrucomicrobiales bacterium BCK34]|nr:hypothetical protein [Verrucomicrobiales bacterium BCK34]
MGNLIQRGKLVICAVILAGGTSSCALRVKVQENWSAAPKGPVSLSAATATWQQIRSGEILNGDSVEKYNEAVRGTVVELTENWAAPNGSLAMVQTDQGNVRIQVEPINVPAIDLIDQLIPADFIRVKRGFRENTIVEGIGTSLLVRQRQSEFDPMVPETGLWYPVTGILNLDNPANPVLELRDPTRGGDLLTGGRSFPLSANYTAAFARDFQDRQFQFLDLPALFQFEKYADRMGLYRISPFDPSKQVCVLVHGIYSSPTTWDITLNRIYEHEDLRERYEFWTFGYPTGAPIPFLASKFRESLHEMTAFRAGAGASPRDMVIVGHSMGGLLSKSVTQHGGDEEWNKVFNVPIEQLNVDEADRKILRRLFYYEPVPNISRVIFCATPHRGSKVAAYPGAGLVGSLIQVPSQLARLTTDIVEQSRYALTPLGLEIAEDRTTSLEQLSSKSRLTGDLYLKPLNPAIHYHSVIASNRGERVSPIDSSDGLVSYRSSHIEGVDSEVVVCRSPHGVHRDEDGIAEIVRLLKLP